MISTKKTISILQQFYVQQHDSTKSSPPKPMKRKKRKKRPSNESEMSQETVAKKDISTQSMGVVGNGTTDLDSNIDHFYVIDVDKLKNGSPKQTKSVSTETDSKKAVLAKKKANNVVQNKEVADEKRKQYFSEYCETLKLDKHGDENLNQFAGLCRGGLTPVKITKNLVPSDRTRRASSKSSNNHHLLPSDLNIPNTSHHSSTTERKKKMVELSETRKSLRKQRSLLSGQACSFGSSGSMSKLNKISSQSSMVLGVDASVGGELNKLSKPDDPSCSKSKSSNNIYATLKRKKKCKSLTGDDILSNRSIAVYHFDDDLNSNIDVDRNSQLKLDKQNFETGAKESMSCDNLNSMTVDLNDHRSSNGSTKLLMQECPEDQLYPWLKSIRMNQYKELLVSNGYDNLNFMVSL